MGLAIVFVTITKALENIDTVAVDYAVDDANTKAIAELNEQKGPLKAALAMDAIISALMLVDFIIHGLCMNMPLRTMPKQKTHMSEYESLPKAAAAVKS